MEHEHAEATEYDDDNEGSVKGSGRGVGQAKAVVRPEHAVGSDGLTILCWEGGSFCWESFGDSGGFAEF